MAYRVDTALWATEHEEDQVSKDRVDEPWKPCDEEWQKSLKKEPPDCPLDERYAVQAETLPH